MTWPHRIFAKQFTDFELKLLRVFRAVVDCGGFSPAEVEMGLTKSAISKHVSDLEIRLGVRLCERGRGGFALTPEGKIVYDSTTQLLVALEEFRSQIWLASSISASSTMSSPPRTRCCSRSSPTTSAPIRA
jgi:DNA-binding transcriptional LysR family regulator